MAEHLVHLQGHNHTGLALADSLFLLGHIGHPVHIVHKYPGPSDAGPGPFLIRIEAELAVAGIFRLGAVGAGIVSLYDSAPGAVTLHQVGHSVEIVPAYLVASVLELVVSGVGVHRKTGSQGRIGSDELPFCVELGREYLLQSHICSGSLLQERVAEFQVAAGSGEHRCGKQGYKYCLLHHQNVMLMPKL